MGVLRREAWDGSSGGSALENKFGEYKDQTGSRVSVKTARKGDSPD